MPLAGEDLDLLATLAAECAAGPQPGRVPVRENRAVINKVALVGGRPLLADTVTDVLRLAAAVSGGDVTLETATRFRSFPRAQRRTVMAALDSVVRDNAAKLAARRLADAPGLLFRSLDRLLRGAVQAEHATVMDIAAQAAPSVSMNVVQGNRLSASLLIRTVIERDPVVAGSTPAATAQAVA